MHPVYIYIASDRSSLAPCGYVVKESQHLLIYEVKNIVEGMKTKQDRATVYRASTELNYFNSPLVDIQYATLSFVPSTVHFTHSLCFDETMLCSQRLVETPASTELFGITFIIYVSQLHYWCSFINSTLFVELAIWSLCLMTKTSGSN